jgi:hypothetical protein
MWPSCSAEQSLAPIGYPAAAMATDKRSRRIPDATIDRAIVLLRAGATVVEAALRVGISKATLNRYLRLRGLTAYGTPGRARDHRRTRHHEPPPLEHAAQVVDMRDRLLTFEQIGAQLGMSPQLARRIYWTATSPRGR